MCVCVFICAYSPCNYLSNMAKKICSRHNTNDNNKKKKNNDNNNNNSDDNNNNNDNNNCIKII